jgi:hypothetical protein
MYKGRGKLPLRYEPQVSQGVRGLWPSAPSLGSARGPGGTGCGWRLELR